MFVHLRGRSTYSMLEGIGSFSDIFQKTKDLGQDMLAITDLYGLYGIVGFYTKSKSFDIKPLIGVELPFVPYLSTFQKQKSDIHPATITFLAKDQEGYHNLLRIVSAGYDNVMDDVPFVDFKLLAIYGKGLVILLGGMNSYIHQISRDTSSETYLNEFVNACISSAGKENCYIDITAQLYSDYPYLLQSHDTLFKISNDFDLKKVTSSGYLYPHASQKDAYETALAIKDGKKSYDPDARKVIGNNHHILSEKEIRDILLKNKFLSSDIDELISTTLDLANSCTTKITLGQALFPKFEPSQNIVDLYEKNSTKLVE